jgi:hypothetical protein
MELNKINTKIINLNLIMLIIRNSKTSKFYKSKRKKSNNVNKIIIISSENYNNKPIQFPNKIIRKLHNIRFTSFRWNIILKKNPNNKSIIL